jgi:hypothetical protein
MTVIDATELWDRTADETSRSFELFAHYRDEGLNRSLRKTAEAFNITKRAVEKMSSRHSWQSRVGAFDRERDRQRQLDNRVAQREMVLRHAQLATLAQQKALESLQALDASRLRPSDAMRMLDLGIKIERLSRGVPSEHVATSAGDPMFEEEEELEGDELAMEVQGFLLGLEAAEKNRPKEGESTANGGEET